MAKRRALIVDDSKTAQILLRKMLERFELDVDTVLSAEEALGYLSYKQPSVIFLDHHMEGMDGLEALKIIKSNPSTALIPVIMYTSEKGDVYVGQARALGAMDIIGKGTIKQESLEKVLSSLGIFDGTTASRIKEHKTYSVDPQESQPPFKASVIPDPLPENKQVGDKGLSEVQKQISRLFEIHIAKVRQEIGDSTKFLLRRLTKEDKLRSAAKSTVPQQNSAHDLDGQMEPVVVPGSSVPTFLLGVIILGIGFLGYKLSENTNLQTLQGAQYQELLARSQAQEKLIGRLFSRVNENYTSRDSAAAFADRQVLLDSLSWAVNVNTQVPYKEQALSDQRIYMLGELLALLTASNFNGEVYLDVHKGNFCVVEDLSGDLILPEPESNIEDCRFLASIIPEIPIEGQVSVGFQNYIHSAPILTEGKISVEMVSRGYGEPQISYPPITSATSAGEWNAVAQKNNRIGISFSAN